MECKMICGNFSLLKHKTIIKKIKKAEPNRAKEEPYKELALKILPKEGFEEIHSPNEKQGVPFDFLACKDNKLALIEMKGKEKGFNYSSPTQYSRLKQVINWLNKKGIENNPFLLQINLEYGMYQIYTKKFYETTFAGLKKIVKDNPEIGKKQNIKPSIKAINDYLEKHKC